MESVELVSNLNELYNGAFSNLITVTFGVVALIGVVIPIAATWIQIRALKSERAAVKLELEKELIALHAELSDSLKKELLTLHIQIKNEVDKRIENVDASTFHIQGLMGLANKHYPVVIEDFVSAAIGYIKSNDEMNAQRCLRIIADECLQKVDKESYEEFEVHEEINRLVSFLKENDVNGRYSNSIDRIRWGAREASHREEFESEESE